MNKHLYYKLDLKLLSPLSIGSGQSRHSDSDIILDSRGEPYIPASSLAGVLRAFCDKENNEDIFLFGNVDKNDGSKKKPDKATPSKVYVYDGTLISGVNKTDTRDSVALDERKVAKQGQKFDFEISSSGLTFSSYLEVVHTAPEDCERRVEKLIGKLSAYSYGLGKKSSRGFGHFTVTAYKKSFDLSVHADRKDWLAFDLFDENNKWTETVHLAVVAENNDFSVLRIPLKLRGGISIRQYIAEAPSGGNEEKVPDYEQLKSGKTPVIPGTSWAGAFRHHCIKILEGGAYAGDIHSDLNTFFGYVETNSKKREENTEKGKQNQWKSLVVFRESEITGGVEKKITRNSIDRFSAATKESALYTEKTYWGGTTELIIKWPASDSWFIRQLLYLCILDLLDGILAVGGLTAIGRGVFCLNEKEAIQLNGHPITISDIESEVSAQ